jgi:soluble lytic murein transglycosylase-like protein
MLGFGIKRVVAAVAGLWAMSAAASPLDSYLKIRSQYGITQAAGAEALETLVGKGTLEVRATVKGVMTVDGRTTLLIALPASQTLSVSAESAPAWLRVPNTSARLIVQASRPNEFADLQATLIAAIEEGTIRAWEEEQRRKAEAAAKARQSKPQTARGTTTRAWNLPPHEAIPVYARFIRGYNPRLTEQQAEQIAHGIIGFSIQFGVDARLITAMVLVESGFNPSATSPKGAMGLGQLMPGTAQGLGVRNAYDTYDNLYGTVRLIRGHLDKYSAAGPDGQKYADLITALAAYNAGSGAVRKYGGVPPYRETQNYIRKVIDWYRRLCGAN